MKQRYFEKISRETISIFGIYPPPLGGVSIHIQRVSDYLTHQYNKVHFFNAEARTFLPLYLCRIVAHFIKVRPTIVQYHATYTRTMIADFFLFWFLSFIFSFELVVIEHDCRHLERRFSITRRFYKRFSKAVSRQIFIGSLSYRSYERYGLIRSLFAIESAFLPPSLHTENSILATYPSSLTIFLDEHTPNIIFNAAHIMLDGERDMYGFDQAVEAIAQLKERYPDIGLSMVVATMNNKKYFKKLYSRMKELNIAENVYILQGQKELWPLFKKADLFIRPSLSDGASISIEEAIFFNVPVVASNAVERPERVTLFETGNAQALAKAIERVLKEKVYDREAISHYMHQESN